MLSSDSFWEIGQPINKLLSICHRTHVKLARQNNDLTLKNVYVVFFAKVPSLHTHIHMHANHTHKKCSCRYRFFFFFSSFRSVAFEWEKNQSFCIESTQSRRIIPVFLSLITKLIKRTCNDIHFLLAGNVILLQKKM